MLKFLLIQLLTIIEICHSYPGQIESLENDHVLIEDTFIEDNESRMNALESNYTEILRGENMTPMGKKLKDLTIDDLWSIKKKSDENVKNPKNEIKDKYWCYPPECEKQRTVPTRNVEKMKNPTKKIYDEKTIELGIYTDKQLLSNLMFHTGKRGKELTTAMLKVIHSLLVQTESLMQLAGYNLALNGIHIWQGDENEDVKGINDALADFSSQTYNKFQTYVMKNNEPYDGHEMSFDASVLLTGMHGIGENYYHGIAVVNDMCTVGSAAISKVALYRDMPNQYAANVLAHELGHLLGASHDDDICYSSDYIMYSLVQPFQDDWSDCSREAFEKAPRNRRPNERDCFFT